MNHDIKTVVLDTHVWLDMFVFDEPRSWPLKSLLGIDCGSLGQPSVTVDLQLHRMARFRAVTSTACIAELQQVLFYPTIQKFWRKKMMRQINEYDVEWVMRQVCQYALWVDVDRLDTLKIPRCQDPKDQMLFELACKAQVAAIISQDRLVLQLAKAMRSLGCQVMTMENFIASNQYDDNQH